MKTLKKTLCVVLAVVMMLGTLTVLASATDFVDDADIAYDEAVEVLVAIGVINGKEGNKFDPKGELTRAEACTIISKLLGQGSLKAKSTFDDAKGHWGESYIAFCASQGIVNGVGDNKFDPDGTLTGYAWAKMVLCALGYNAEYEGMTGDEWELGVAKLMGQTHIGDALASFDGEKAIPRDAACQLAFTGAKDVDMQKFTPGIAVTGTNLSVNAGGSYDTIYGAAGHKLLDDGFKIPAANITAAATDYNEPGTNYLSTDGKVNVTVEETPAATYTTAVTSAQIYKDLGLKGGPDNNGIAAGATSTHTMNQAAVEGAGTFAITIDGAGVIGGNGILTKVYYDTNAANAEGKKVIIVCIPTFFDDISVVTPAAGAAARKVNTTGGAVNFETEDFEVGDKVLVTYDATGTATAIKAVEGTELTATAINTNANTFTAGGKTYEYANTFGTDGSIPVAAADVTTPTAFVAYLDDYGYVIGKTATAAAAATYCVVLAQNNVMSLDGGTNQVRVLKTDGTIEDGVSTAAVAGGANPFALCTYTMNKSGQYVLTVQAALDTGAGSVVNKGAVAVTAATTATKGNAKTIFLLGFDNDGDGNDDEYKAYVGINAVPTLTNAAASGANCVDFDTDGFAEVVFIKSALLAAAGTTSSDIVFVDYSSENTMTDANLGTYYEYNAIVNGKVETIKAAANTVFTADGIFTAFTKDSDGLITAKTPMTATGDITAYVNNGVGTDAAANGIIELDGTELSYNDATQIFKIAADGSISAVTVASVKFDANDTVVYYTTNNVLTYAVITEV